MNKKSLLFCIFILLIVLLLFILYIEKDNSDNLSRTRTIISKKYSALESKKITNSNEIDQIIKIINNRKDMPKDTIVLCENASHFIIKMRDKYDKTITSIDFYYYSNNLSWIVFNNEDINKYIIDAESLLKIIDY